jgi:hypothetical protein
MALSNLEGMMNVAAFSFDDNIFSISIAEYKSFWLKSYIGIFPFVITFSFVKMAMDRMFRLIFTLLLRMISILLMSLLLPEKSLLSYSETRLNR